MQKEYEILVWKDINKVPDTLTELEVERFWACFMFLFVMPPKHRDIKGNSTWKFRTYASTPYVPQCRYDEFIASHSTSCEHHTNYFCYYHRNLVSKYQLALNEADYALRHSNKGEEIDLVRREVRRRRIEEQFNKAISYYQDLIKRLQAERKKQNKEDKLPWVAPFYWNVANFKEKIKIPQIFSHPPKEGQNPMFDFHRAYKGCNFGEVNYNETWEKQGTGRKWWNSIRYFARTLDRFTREQQRLIHAEDTNLESRVNNKSRIVNKINYNANFRAYDNLERKNGVTQLSNLTEDELNYNLGGKGSEFINTENIQDSEAYTDYNDQIPYYSYVKALLTPFENMCPTWGGADGFLSGRDSISTPHDQIHNNNGFILGDPSFSITHPLFMLYHGFIEYMTEQYLRMAKKHDVNSKAFASLNRFLNARIPFRDFQTGNRNMQMRFGGFFIGFYRLHWRNLNTNGEYPCFEWFDNTLEDFSQLRDDVTHYARGTYQDLMAVRDENSQLSRLRYSDELRGFYEPQLNDMKLPEQLKEFPFNFTFDILLENQKLNRDYPDYIQEVVSEIRMNQLKNSSKLAFRTAAPAPLMEEDLERQTKVGSSLAPQNAPASSALKPQKVKPVLLKEHRQMIQKFLLMNFQKAIKNDLGPSQLKGFKDFPDTDPQLLHELKKVQDKTKAFNKNVQKFCSLYGRVQYPSNLDTFVVGLNLKIKDLNSFKFVNSGEDSISKLKNKIVKAQGQFGIHKYPVFNKSNLSEVCPRCLQSKTQTFNLAGSFKGAINPLLIDLHLNSSFGILYDSQGKLPIQKSFESLLETSNNHPDNSFQFKVISGAVQVILNVIKCVDVYSNEKVEQDSSGLTYEVHLKAESFDLVTGQPFIWLKSTKKSLNTEIVFEELELPRDPNTKENGKELVYKRIVGELFIRDGTKTTVKDFQFDIKNYFYEASYDVRIDSQHNILVRDTYIEEKRKVFF